MKSNKVKLSQKDQRFLEKVLIECNKVRERIGFKPVKKLRIGVKDESDSCPIANTVNDGDDVVSMERNELIININGREIAIKHSLFAEFVKRFDKGEFPHLDEYPCFEDGEI